MNNDVLKLKNNKDWGEFKNYYMEYNMFSQINFFRYEDMHTNILCSLFDSNNAYKLGTYPLKKLIELLINTDNNKTKIKINELENYNIDNVNIFLQKVVENNRLDLKIDFSINNINYSIILENKVFSEEHNEQCKRYYDYFITNNHVDNTNYIFVYLSLEKNPEFSYKNKYICINYQELITYVIEPCSEKCVDPNPKIISLDTYLLSFSKLYEYLDNNYVIPITKQGKNLTINLYNSCNNLLIKSLESNDDFYKENKKLLDIYYYNVLKLINDEIIIDNETKKTINSKLFNIRCTFNGVNRSYKDCYLYIVKYLFDMNLIKTEDDLNKLNRCVLLNNYILATPDYDSLYHEDYYYLSNSIVGTLKLNNKKIYYYVGPVSKIELKYFVEKVNNLFNNVLENIVTIN